jgi:hypothetical protein
MANQEIKCPSRHSHKYRSESKLIHKISHLYSVGKQAKFYIIKRVFCQSRFFQTFTFTFSIKGFKNRKKGKISRIFLLVFHHSTHPLNSCLLISKKDGK